LSYTSEIARVLPLVSSKTFGAWRSALIVHAQSPARALGHCISQAFYDGGWHFYDGDMHSPAILTATQSPTINSSCPAAPTQSGRFR